MLAPHYIVGAVALALASVSGVISTFVGYEIFDKVNAKLPMEEQFDPPGWYFSKTQRLYAEYKRLYPEGRLLAKARLLQVVMVACVAICALALEFFR